MPRKIESIREKMLKSTREQISRTYANEEYALMQAINAYNELSRSYNLVYERLSEWYGLYYPEIKAGSQKLLADMVKTLNTRDTISKESLTALFSDEQRAASVYEKATSSMGRAMSGRERDALMKFADASNSMNETLEALEAYIKAAANEIMPNATYITDEKIAAELLSRAGSMERLATMPASTVQLLGAEKALFKHIKFGSKPPKYGVLFKLPAISNGKRSARGKIARLYATKVAIALKADYFSKRFIAEKLKSDIEKGIARINSKPDVAKNKRHSDRGRHHKQ
ncbi:MAG: NOP58 family protein [Candidatus Marsarchaeota archaeon]|jgi:nucleolar protein 56|nr:NOP58 family protein [Candidatus Marsarchaeota archaeon]MCL5418890.1 NOP58 family protein [Candidatus Marsarchaeota archaeon]